MNIKQTDEKLVFDIRTLRLIIGVLALAFPPVVIALAGKVTTSISASYHEEQTRDVFVGFLFILGALLISYKGHRLPISNAAGGKLWVRIQRDQEDWISAIGGIAAIFTALFPTTCDGCSIDTKGRIHTIGAFLLFAPVIYFSLIAFLRSLNLKLKAYGELSGIEKVAGSGPRSRFGSFFDYLSAEIIFFRCLVMEASRIYDTKQPKLTNKLSLSYRREKIAYLLSAYGKKIRRGFIYVICGVVITVVLLGSVPMGLVFPSLVTQSKLTFLVEAISLWLFGFAWMTASHLGYLRKLRLLRALRQRKQPLVPELGSA